MRFGINHGRKKKGFDNLESCLKFLNEHPRGSIEDPEVNCELCEKLSKVSGEKPDCENCHNPVLSPANKEVWDLYQKINTKFVYDFNALPLVFEIHSIQCTRGEAKEILQKLIMIHSFLQKHKKSDNGK